MKKKGGNGDGSSLADVTVEILKGIRDEIAGLRKDTNLRFGGLEGEIRELRTEMHELRSDIDSLETATIRGFEGVAARLENIRDFAGERWRDHEERIRRLEARGERGDPTAR